MSSRITLVISMLFLTACGGAPDCNFKGKGVKAPSAGCLVVHEGKVLLMEGRSGFGPPGGSVDGDETAQCGAERETYEESGVEVTAGELAVEFDNGFQLFWCEPVGAPKPAIQRPLEVSSVAFYSPEELPTLRWRFPEQGALFYRMIQE